jgi:antitoxin (DNA-binding transcriptional repressor) of toxin-antitoxin stability system
MATYTIHAAKTNLSKLIALAEAGEEVVLARGKEAVVKIVPVASKAKPKRKFGALKGKIKIGPEFFDPLPEEELKRWE